MTGNSTQSPHMPPRTSETDEKVADHGGAPIRGVAADPCVQNRTLLLTIPTDLPAALSPNARVGWRGKSAATKTTRSIAWYSTAPPPGLRWDVHAGRLRIDATIYWAKGRKTMDDDNAIAMLKPVRDGVADALNRNDRDFVMGSLVQTRDKDGAGYVVLTLSEMEP